MLQFYRFEGAGDLGIGFFGRGDQPVANSSSGVHAAGKVKFAAGTSDDPNFGGYLITPAGSRVALVFENNLWRVPLWAPPIRAPAGHITPAKVLIKSGTTKFLPAPCSTQDLKAVSTIKHIIATIQHDGFLHPLGVEQGYIGNGLRETAVNEYIKQT